MLRKRVYDVAICGGGVMGSSIAYHLSKAGWKNVVVLERDPCYTNCSALLSAGGIRQQFSVRENILMSKYGIEFLKNPQFLSVKGEIPDYQFHENGYTFLSSTDQGMKQLHSNNATQHEAGADWIHVLTAEQLALRFPWMNTADLTGGTLSDRNEGYFDPWALLSALKRKAISQGVEFRDAAVCGAEMEPVAPESGSTMSTSLKIKAVHIKPKSPLFTPYGAPHSTGGVVGGGNGVGVESIHANWFVNACGAWAGGLVDIFAEAAAASSHNISMSGGSNQASKASERSSAGSYSGNSSAGSTTSSPKTIAPLPVKARKRTAFSFHVKAFSSTNSSTENSDSSVNTMRSADGESTEVIIQPHATPLVIDPCGVWFRSEGSGADGKFICGVSPSDDGEQREMEGSMDSSANANAYGNASTGTTGSGPSPSTGMQQQYRAHSVDPDCTSDAQLQNPDHHLFEEIIWPALYERVPAFGELKLMGSWAGFYEYNTVDQNMIVGMHPDIPNLMLCNGFSGHGLQQAPAAGRAVSELLTDGRFSSIDLSRFTFDRILRKEPIFEEGIV